MVSPFEYLNQLAAILGPDWPNLVTQWGILIFLAEMWLHPLNEAFSRIEMLRLHIPPRECMPTVDSLCDLIWQETARVMLTGKGHSDFVLLCNRCLLVVLAFLMPATIRWRKKCPFLETLVATLIAAKSIVWLQQNRCHPVSRKVLALASLQFQRAVLEPTFPLLTTVLQWLRSCLGSQHDTRHFGLYAWFARGFLYIGMAGFSRVSCPAVSGLVCRLFEHLTLRARSHCPQSRLHRYKLARRVPLTSMMWLPVRQGHECEIRARECVAIKMFNPCGNVVHAPRFSANVRAAKARCRPPPWRRRSKFTCVNNVWCAPPGVRTLDREIVRQFRICDSKASTQVSREVACTAWSMSFTEAYRSMQKTMLLRNEFGPINIYDASVRRLMVLWVACKGVTVEWDRLRNSWSCCSVGVELNKLGQLVSVPARRRQVLMRAARCLRFEGLPAQRLLVVRVPEQCLVAPCKKLLRVAARKSTKWPCHIVNWVLRKTRVVVSKPPRLSDDLSQGRFAGSFRKEHVESLPEDVVAACLQGYGMKKLEVDTRTKKLLPLAAKVDAMQTALKVWWQQSRLGTQRVVPCLGRVAACVSACPSVVGALDRQAAYSEEYELCYRETLGKGMVRVADDKDKNRMWLIQRTTYSVLLYCYAVCCQTWAFTRMSKSVAEETVLLGLRSLVPVHLQLWLGVRVAGAWLPYVYMTIKSKCYCTSRRICVKFMHSCCRKIIAYCRWPRRKNWRLLSRALDLILRRWGQGFEVVSLKKAAAGLREACEMLVVVGDGTICCSCGHAKPVLSGLVADAGQFFEAVEPAVAIQSVVDILSLVQSQHGHSTVTVLRDQRVRGFLGGCPEANSRKHKAISFYFVDLVWCFAACMSVCLCSLGSLVIRTSGLPIGGLMSRIAASYVLAWQEYLWVLAWPQSTYSRKANVEWSCAVVARRYIDDAMFISKLFCYDCLSRMLKDMYSVTFDVAARSRQLQWLDLIFDLDTCEICIKRNAFQFPPVWDTRQQDLKAFLWGRLARYKQLGLKRPIWEHDLGCLLVSLSRQQFSRRRLRNLVFGMWNDAYSDEILFLRSFICSQVFRKVFPLRV